ncbi:MAG TPA: METTL5 family protein [Candidatus Thermoplasmatota archaeon]|nr:METTL5 family protein [Candidatus Thermoplasmatota archaeon]
MRLNDIERMLSSIPPHPAPKLELEQYETPAALAAPLLFEAVTMGDIEGRRIVDLGCGTGVFAIGAALLGAASATGVDVDAASIELARGAARKLRAAVDWVEADVRGWRGAVDTVLMNPPFGAQQRGADRAFLDAAMASAPVVYTLHNAATRAFVESYAAEGGFRATHAWRLLFPLRHQYRHQEKAVQEIEVVALRLTKSRESA